MQDYQIVEDSHESEEDETQSFSTSAYPSDALDITPMEIEVLLLLLIRGITLLLNRGITYLLDRGITGFISHVENFEICFIPILLFSIIK